MQYIRKNIQLAEEQNNQLRKLAFDTRKSESEHIRIALDKYLEEVSPMYEKNGEWSGYSITKSDKGFVVTLWSRIQGGIDGAKYLYQFDNTFTSETELSAQWNEGMTYGEYLGQSVYDQYNQAKEYGLKSNIKRLAKGNKVQ